MIKSRRICGVICLAAMMCLPGPVPNASADNLVLPAPGKMIGLSAPAEPVMLKGLRYDPAHPFQFEFILSEGDQRRSPEQLKTEGMNLVRFFMAALTLPPQDQWVNLSPYERDRIISPSLAVTNLGGALLAQDYVLKQLASSLTFPQGERGREFWRRVYGTAASKLGRTDAPVAALNKVWIVPESAQVLVHGNTVLVTRSHLKVMAEGDYVAQKKHGASAAAGTSGYTQAVKDVLVPALEEEVNRGAQFARLRQIVHAAILAEWYRRHLRQSPLARAYTNQRKVRGIDDLGADVKDSIYRQYLAAYKKGVYNFIREETLAGTQAPVPRKYFSGGMNIHIADLSEATDWAMVGGRYAQGPAGEGVALRVDMRIVQEDKALPKTAQEFINTTENPFLTNMKFRARRQADALLRLDPGLIERIIVPERRTGGWSSINAGGLEQKEIYEVRVANSSILGPAKGGIRWIRADDLMKDDAFAKAWRDLLVFNPNRAQIKGFLAKWLKEEAEALALGMTLKTAGVDIGLGGGKGTVFMGDIVQEADGKWQLRDWPFAQEPKWKYIVARHHARALAQSRAVGIDSDSPAPDMNTTPEILATYNDEYIRVLVEQGNAAALFRYQGREYSRLLERLKAVLAKAHEYPVEATPFLQAVLDYGHQTGFPIPWAGVFTGKVPELGGVHGRNEATGEGVVKTMMLFFDSDPAKYKGKSIAVQAFGNVGRYTALAAAREGFKVQVINDAGITLISERGWTVNQLNDMITWLSDPGVPTGRTLQEYWARGRVPVTPGVRVVVDSPADVFKAVMGAKVDVLVPAFREAQITEEVVPLIQAPVIIEAANGPTTAAAEQLLLARGIVIVPDLLTNAGGVIVSGLEMLQARTGRKLHPSEVQKIMFDYLERAFTAVRSLVEKAKAEGQPMSYRRAFDQVALFNLATGRMRVWIRQYKGELSRIIAISGPSASRSVVEARIKGLGLDQEMQETARRTPAEEPALTDRASLAQPENGGIDLDTTAMPIKQRTEGQGMMTPLPAGDAQQWQNAPGFVPVFVGLRPLQLSSLWKNNAAQAQLALK